MDLSIVLEHFQTIGAELCRDRLVSRHGGNLSVRTGNRMLVTRHGCGLGRLGPDDLVEVDIAQEGPVDAVASLEAEVHRAIYRLTDARAVVHAHPSHAIALSFKAREIVPPDMEGEVILGRVPVVGWGEKFGPGQGCDVIARAFSGSKVVMVRSHGCFAIGATLEEACNYATILEESCRIFFLVQDLR